MIYHSVPIFIYKNYAHFLWHICTTKNINFKKWVLSYVSTTKFNQKFNDKYDLIKEFMKLGILLCIVIYVKYTLVKHNQISYKFQSKGQSFLKLNAPH